MPTITIDLGAVLAGLVAILGAVALVALVIVLIRLAKTLKQVNELLAGIKAPVNETVEKLPAVMENVSGTLENVHDISDVANDLVTDAGAMVESFIKPDGAAGTVASIAGAATAVVELVHGLMEDKKSK